MPFPHEPSPEERNTVPTRVGARGSAITPDSLRRDQGKRASRRRQADVSTGALGSFQYNKSQSYNYALFPEILRAPSQTQAAAARALSLPVIRSESPLGVLTWTHQSPSF